MATKKAPAKAEVKAEDVKVEAPAAAEEKAAPASRGPRGVTEDAKITVNVAANPKREGSKAAAVFSHYETGMTVKAFCDSVGEAATPNLVYDAKKGFITIEGYEVPGGVEQPKPKKEPKAKAEPKPKKEKKAAAAETEPVVDPEVEEEVV